MREAWFTGRPGVFRQEQGTVGHFAKSPPAPSLSLHLAPRCPRSSGLTRAAVEQVAETWSGRVADRGAADWLGQFVSSCGGEIRLDETSKLLVVAVRPDSFVISTDSPWQVAEALGHVALHLQHLEACGNELPVLAIQRATPTMGDLARARAEAGWFAAAFLLPRSVIEDSWTRHRGLLRDMALELRTPRALVASRVARLGLL